MSMPTIVNIHAIQTVPASNINRDRNGAPKSGIFGGKRRHQVSSQSWKRAIRELLKQTGKDAGTNNSRSFIEVVANAVANAEGVEVSQEIVDRVTHAAIMSKLLTPAALTSQRDKALGLSKPKKKAEGDEGDEEEAEPDADVDEMTGVILYKTGAAFPFTLDAVSDFAALVTEMDEHLDAPLYSFKTVPKPNSKTALTTSVVEAKLPDENKALLKDWRLRARDIIGAISLNTALFGRMLASEPTLNVDAAAQVAFAVGVSETAPQSDFYTAVDDLSKGHSGASMMGTVEYDASTLYRYANVNVDQMVRSLGASDDIGETVAAFVEAFIVSMPSGAQNKFANLTLPSTVIVTIGRRGVNHAGAYLETVDEDFVSEATSRLVDQEIVTSERVYAPELRLAISLDGSTDSHFSGMDVAGTLGELLDAVSAHVQSKVRSA